MDVGNLGAADIHVHPADHVAEDGLDVEVDLGLSVGRGPGA